MASSFLLFWRFAALGPWRSDQRCVPLPTGEVVVSTRSSGRHLSAFQQGAGDNGSGRAEPRTGDHSWLLRDFVLKAVAQRETAHRGSAIAEARRSSVVSFSQSDVPDGAVRKRAVVQRFSWRYWLRTLGELLTSGRTAGRCILMAGLSSILEGPQREVHVEECHFRRGCIGDIAATWRLSQRSGPTLSASSN